MRTSVFRASLFSALLSALFLASGACSSQKEKSEPEASAAASGEAKVADSKSAPQAKSKKGDEPKELPKPIPEPTDKGEASMTIGGIKWEAQKSYARQKGEVLLVKASYTENAKGVVRRQELHIEVTGYKGPGSYVTDAAGSRFVGVGMKAEAAKKAAGNTAAEKRELHNALETSNHLMLNEMKVEITEASETEVRGSFSWTGTKKSEPAIEGGRFRAPILP